MTTEDLHQVTTAARLLRHRMAIARLDYRRELLRLASLDFTQRQLAKALGISQPSLNDALKKAADAEPPRPGFSGTDPYEICQRFALGMMSRERLVAELTSWDYAAAPTPEHDHFDDLRFTTPGSVDDVGRAFDDSLLDGEAYDEVLMGHSRRAGFADGGTFPESPASLPSRQG